MQTTIASDFEIIAQGFKFIEAPRISPQGDIWFSDLIAGGVYRKRVDHDIELMLPGRSWVGGLLLDESGAVLCGGRGGIVILDPQTGRTRELLSQIEGQPIIAVNDMEGDGRGGFFAGTVDFVSIFENGAKPSAGLFFHMSDQGEVTVLRRDVVASNGIAASPCGRWLYHSETSRGIWRYPLGPSHMPGIGELLITLEDSDGLAVDSMGHLWVACWESGRLARFAADGTWLDALSFPYPHIVSIAFALDDLTNLYITTGGNSDATAAGAVLRIRTKVAGVPGPRTRLRGLEAPV